MAGDEETLKEIGSRMRMYWGAFAHTGAPEVPGQAEWKPYDRENRYTLLIDREDSLSKDPEKESRLLYEGIDRVLI